MKYEYMRALHQRFFVEPDAVMQQEIEESWRCLSDRMSKEDQKNDQYEKHIAAARMTAALVAGLAVPATATELPAIRVSSCKGGDLEIGERGGLIIGPSGTDYTVASSDPDTVAVERCRLVKQTGQGSRKESAREGASSVSC